MSGVATFDSHGRAPCLLGRIRYARPGCCFPYANLPNRRAKTAELTSACSSRWIRPCLSQDEGRPSRIDLVPACPSSPPQGAFLSDCSPSGPKIMRSTPQATYPGPFGPMLSKPVRPVLFAPLSGPLCRPTPRFLSRQSLCPRAVTGRRSAEFRSPFGSDRRDPNTLAPNRRKTRTTPLRPSRISA